MRTDMDCTPTNYGKTSIRILNKGPDYFRSTSINSQNSDGKKKTAAERLAADKLKYVKSAKARQLQKLNDMSPTSQNNDSTGSHSMGTSSTGSPMNIEDDDSDFTNNTTPESYRPVHTRATPISNPSSRAVTRANTNADIRSRDRFRHKQRNRSASEQLTNGQIVTPKSGETAVNQLRLNRSEPNKNSAPAPVAKNNELSNTNKTKPVKTFSSYLNKAKEGIKAVTANIASANVVAETQETPKGRQSRSTKSRTSKYRSASVGAGAFQKREQASRVINPVLDSKGGPESPTMSPRTQLKHVRQNLKKVNSTPSAITKLTDENRESKFVSPSHKPVGRTFTVNPKQADQNTFLRCKNPTKDTSNMPRALRGRPLSVIENRSGNHFSESLNSSQSEQKLRRRSASSGKYVENDGNDIHFGASLNGKNYVVENRLNIQAQNLKRRSWDLSHTMDNSLQLSLSKPISLTPDADVVLTSPLTQTPRQRKSWSRIPSSTSEYRKSQEFSQNRSGLRKNIAEALEEIFTPLEDDDMDTAYHSMSPDASMECKTLVNQEKDNGSEKISKTPESSRTPTGSQSGNSSGGNDIDLSKTPKITQQPQIYPEERLWSTYKNNLAAQQSQPLNRIDLAPTKAIHNSHSSPMLAPKSRREVAPDYSSRNLTNSLSRNAKEEGINTLRSQNTSSSASVDASKPFTALTASDLKPRRTKRNVMAHAAPLKPTYPYSLQPHNLRINTKRHNNAPISPTLSPHKQAARMASHGSRSSSSTPYSSLKRTPTSSNSKSSSLKRNRQRSKSDVSLFQFELDRFFSSMGMEECLISPLPDLNDTLFTTAHVSSESDFSFAGASAYVRDSPDEALPMEVDPMTAGLAHVPAVSIIEKNARVMKWLMACKKSGIPASPSANKNPGSPRIPVSVPYHEQEQNQNSYAQNNKTKNRNYEVIIDKRQHSGYSRKPSSPRGIQVRSHMSPPPVPSRLHSSFQPNHNTNSHPKESDV